MGIKYTLGGRSVSLSQLMSGIEKKIVDAASDKVVELVHGKAASIVDPVTGKHPVVIVRQIGGNRFVVRTSGSKEYASELERRLGLKEGSVTSMESAAPKNRLVYFAHATEDKDSATPIAKGLLARGIDVWFGEWEISAGDSLRRKMEEGLNNCTHFIALLTPISVLKPWVNEEIDAGLMAQIEGSARFIGLRMGIDVGSLSPFLKSKLCPEIQVSDAAIDGLAADIMGVSRKPPLGRAPRYVKAEAQNTLWSNAAMSVAEVFVRNSKFGSKFDPQMTLENIEKYSALPSAEIRLGMLDLRDAGLVENSMEVNSSVVFPLPGLFTEFDSFFMEWDPKEDAKEVATYIFNLNEEQIATKDVGEKFGWAPRRLNPAMNYLVEARAVRAVEAISGDYRPMSVFVDDNLLRFVRNNC